MQPICAIITLSLPFTSEQITIQLPPQWWSLTTSQLSSQVDVFNSSSFTFHSTSNTLNRDVCFRVMPFFLGFWFCDLMTIIFNFHYTISVPTPPSPFPWAPVSAQPLQVGMTWCPVFVLGAHVFCFPPCPQTCFWVLVAFIATWSAFSHRAHVRLLPRSPYLDNP